MSENEVNTEEVEKSVDASTPTQYTVSMNVAQAVINYLATKPYNEVSELIAAFQQGQAS